MVGSCRAGARARAGALRANPSGPRGCAVANSDPHKQMLHKLLEAAGWQRSGRLHRTPMHHSPQHRMHGLLPARQD